MLSNLNRSTARLSYVVRLGLAVLAAAALVAPAVYVTRPADAAAEDAPQVKPAVAPSVQPVPAAKPTPAAAPAAPAAPVSPLGRVVAPAAPASAPAPATVPAVPTPAPAQQARPAPAPAAAAVAPAAPASVNVPGAAPATTLTLTTTYAASPAVPARAKPPRVEFFPALSPSEEKITRALDGPTEFDFQETPLSEVIDFLRDKHAIEIQVDEKSLADVAVDPSTPITRSAKEVSLRSALRLILRQLDLDYIVDDDVLQITSEEFVEQVTVTRVYPVGDLVAGGPRGADDYDGLIEALTASVDPETWNQEGGQGSISPAHSSQSLVILQTHATHDKVLRLLRAMRKARQPDAGE